MAENTQLRGKDVHSGCDKESESDIEEQEYTKIKKQTRMNSHRRKNLSLKQFPGNKMS
jgi:hypothetical protein